MIGGDVDPVARAEDQLHRLFPDDPGLRGAVRWARRVLADAALEPSSSPLRSVRALRRADHRLSAVAARFLVDSAAGRAPTPGRRHVDPRLE